MDSTLCQLLQKKVPEGIKVYDFTRTAETNEKIIFQVINSCINNKNKLVVFRNTNKVKQKMVKYVLPKNMRAFSQFQSNVPWIAFQSDNSYGPTPEMDTERAVEQAIDVFFGNNTCCVCLESLQDTPATIVNCCEQLIHDECLLKCFLRDPLVPCPLCRGSI